MLLPELGMAPCALGAWFLLQRSIGSNHSKNQTSVFIIFDYSISTSYSNGTETLPIVLNLLLERTVHAVKSF